MSTHLKNENAVNCAFCSKPIHQTDNLNMHHPHWRSKGGTEIVPTHRECHVNYHSSQNHFREWGRKGGIITASKGYWIFNLWRGRKDFGGKTPDPLRWIPFGR